MIERRSSDSLFVRSQGIFLTGEAVGEQILEECQSFARSHWQTTTPHEKCGVGHGSLDTFPVGERQSRHESVDCGRERAWLIQR